MHSLDSIKNIRLYQRIDGYRFSVDALLLFSFIDLQRVKRIVDIGAGSGVIGLLLAKKYRQSEVALLELQEGLATLAERNVTLNNLEQRVSVMKINVSKIGNSTNPKRLKPPDRSHTPLSTLHEIEPFDLAVSNPPFRKVNTGRLNAVDERTLARHEVMLSLEELACTSSFLLRHHGRLCIIHLPGRLAEIASILRDRSLEPKRLRFVHSKPSTEAKMVLIEAVKGGKTGLTVERPLFIYKEDGSYTDELNEIYA